MSRPLPYYAYLALRRGSGAGPGVGQAGAETRPPGPLLWAHCSGPEELAGLDELVDRLRADGDRLGVVASYCATAFGTAPPMAGTAGLTLVPLGEDTLANATGFLRHWQPDVLLWLGLPLWPVLLGEAAALPMARFLIDTGGTAALVQSGGWIPGITRSTLAAFDEVLCTDGAGATRLRKAGLGEDQMRLVGPFEPGGRLLPHAERDRLDLAHQLGARPVWHAADVPQAELATVITAHRLASRRAHRLMLVLSTDPEDEAAAADLCRTEGLRIASRAAGEDPGDEVDVLLTDTAEPGLWFRIAPLSYLGGTFTGGPGRDPFHAAALGSAVMHGPDIQHHKGHFDRLAKAGAARAVARAQDLGHALETLLAPDKTAAIAHAAWGVTSAGAETGNRVAALIRDRLDRVEG